MQEYWNLSLHKTTLFSLGPLPTGTQTIALLDPTFGSFTLLEPVSLMKVFKLEQMFFGVESVDTLGTCTTSLSFGGASVFVMMPC